jgi:hypothetical protein
MGQMLLLLVVARAVVLVLLLPLGKVDFISTPSALIIPVAWPKLSP